MLEACFLTDTSYWLLTNHLDSETAVYYCWQRMHHPPALYAVLLLASMCLALLQSKEKGKDGKGAVAIRQPYLRVVGLEEDIEGDAHNSPTFT